MHSTDRLWPAMAQHLGRKCLVSVGCQVAVGVDKCVVVPVWSAELTHEVVAEHDLAFTSVPQQCHGADGERV